MNRHQDADTATAVARRGGRPRVKLIVAAEFHDADYARRELLGMLAEDDRPVTVAAENFGDPAALDEVDFLITYTNNVFPDAAGLEALDRFVARGGKWLAIHGSAAFTRFKPPPVDIGGIQLPGLTDTPDLQPHYMDLLGCRFVSHLAQQPFVVRPVSSHPLVAGIDPFEIVDEPYILELRAECEVLLEARYTGEAPGYVEGPFPDDDPRPQLLLRRHGAGEILYLAPGHACGRFDLRPFIDEMPVQRGPWIVPAYREILRRALRWGTGQPILSARQAPGRDDRVEILDVAADIDRAVDEKDWVRMRSHFADRVAVDIGLIGGAEIVELSGDAFVAEVARINPPTKNSWHSHTNALVTIDGDTATLLSHSYGWNQCPALEPSVYEVWGTLDYRFSRIAGKWRATQIRLAKSREAGNPRVSEWRGPEAPSAGR
jgi:type 1 glutamine amidotransferase